MRIRAKHILFTLGGLVAVGAALGVGAVAYVQNTDMRGWATWGAKKAGYTVAFSGPLEVKLWPTLLVKARGIEVASVQGPGSLAKIDALALQADWGGGLTPWEGIQLRAIEAKNPTLNLQRTAAGVANWEQPGATNAPQTAEPASTANPIETLTAQGGVLASVRLAIANLNVTYADAQSGQRMDIKAMNIGARTSGTVATTTLKGTVNDQSLEGELVADVADFADIPLKGRLEGMGAALALEGRVTQPRGGSTGFAGLINARSGDVRGTLKTLLGKAPAQAPNSPASLTGDVVLNAGQVVLRNFSARLGELLQARGDVDITLGATPKGSGELSVQGANLRTLAELFSSSPQPSLPAKPFNLQGKLAGEKTLTIEDLVLNIEPVLRLTGMVSITPQTGLTGGGQPDIAATLSLNAPNFAELLAAFGQRQQAPREALQATLNVQGKGGVYTLQNVVANLADLAKLQASGSINASKAEPVIDVKAELSGTDMAKAASGFGISQVPSSGFSIRANVQGSGPYEVEGLTINLPGLAQAIANLTVGVGTPANVTGDITFTQLNATKLGLCGTSSSGSNSTAGGATKAAASNAAPWSDEALDLSALRTVGLNVKVQANGITCASYPVQQVALTLRNTPSQLDVQNLDVTLADNAGSLSGNLGLMHAGTPQLNTTLKLTNLRPEALVATLAQRGVRLPLNGALEFASQGTTTRALAQNLGGRVALQATQGMLPYSSMLGNVVAIERLLQGSASLPANGDGTIDNLDVVLVFRQGVGAFESLKAGTGNGAMTLNGTGQLDLPNWTIDLTLTPELATSSGLAIPILVRGPLTAPAIGADPAFTQRLTQRLATEGLKGALGLDKESAKGLGGVVGDVLGGKGLTAEGVGNLLSNFGKKKETPSPTAPAAPATTPEPAAEPTAQPTPEPAPEASPAAPTNPLEQALPGLINGVLGQ